MDQPTTTQNATVVPPESVHQRNLREAKARRQRALEMRNGSPEKTYKEIGAALGVTPERARQMVEQAQRETSAG